MMTKEWRILASCLFMVWLVGCNPGNVAYREARKAELRKDWDTALVEYEKAGREIGRASCRERVSECV